MRHSNHSLFMLIGFALILSVAVVLYQVGYVHAAHLAPKVKSAEEVSGKCKGNNNFAVGDEVHARGKGFLPNTPVKIYIIEQDDRCIWKFGDSIGTDASGGAETVTTSSKGKLPCTLIWGSASAGNHDIIVDANQDGIFNVGDAVDAIVVGSGLSVTKQPTISPAGVRDSVACGRGQFSFLVGEDVYVEGRGFNPNDTVNIYVKTNQGWMPGDPIGTDDGDGVDANIVTTPAGLLPCTKIWTNPLTIGEYDIVVDVNQDGNFNAGDVVNNRCLEIPVEPGDLLTGAGFRVQ